MTRVAVLADTHVAPGSSRRVPDTAWAQLQRAEIILHAGDVTSPELLSELEALAPVHAVLGNNDHDLVGVLPERTEFEIDGVRVAMVHDSGATAGRERRLHRWFPAAQLVVFGHSHQPVNEPGVDGQRLLNPGSPTWKRRAPIHTMAMLELAEGQISEAELIDLAADPGSQPIANARTTR